MTKGILKGNDQKEVSRKKVSFDSYADFKDEVKQSGTSVTQKDDFDDFDEFNDLMMNFYAKSMNSKRIQKKQSTPRKRRCKA